MCCAGNSEWNGTDAPAPLRHLGARFLQPTQCLPFLFFWGGRGVGFWRAPFVYRQRGSSTLYRVITSYAYSYATTHTHYERHGTRYEQHDINEKKSIRSAVAAEEAFFKSNYPSLKHRCGTAYLVRTKSTAVPRPGSARRSLLSVRQCWSALFLADVRSADAVTTPEGQIIE